MRLANKTLERLKEESYLNSVRLLTDAYVLFGAGSYATAFALAVLSQEELGKLNMVDHICDDIVLNGDRSLFVRQLLSKHMFCKHVNKQEWAYDSGLYKSVPRHLERSKQRALYVDYSKGRVRPPKVGRATSLRQIRRALYLIADVEDLGFNGFYCEGTAATRQRARVIVSRLRRDFEGMTGERP